MDNDTLEPFTLPAKNQNFQSYHFLREFSHSPPLHCHKHSETIPYIQIQ